MAENTGERSRMTRTRKRSPAAVAILCCGLLVLLGISSAAAHPGHGKPASAGPPSSAPSPSSGAGPGNGAGHGAPAPSPPPAAGPSGPPAAAATPPGHGHGGGPPSGHGHGGPPSGQGPGGTAQGAPEGHGNAPYAPGHSGGIAHGNGNGLGKAGGAGKGGGAGKASAATLSAPQVKTPASPRVSAPNLPASQPASAVIAPLAQPGASGQATPAATQPSASAPAAAQPAPTAAPSASKRGAGKNARRASRHAHKSHRRTGAAAHRAGARSASGAISASSAAASRGGSRAHRARSTHRPQAAGQLEPIVKTITKIVGVVPLVVRVLIGVLLALALALAVRSRLAALRARRLERQRAQLLEDVGLLQAALLPVSPARIGPVGTSVAYRPADGPAAGGDFYDVFALESGLLGVVVGDVSGHGRQALPHTALLRFTLRAYLEAGLSPREVLRTAGTVLERQLGESFATVVVATYHPRERLLTYSSAGHPPPIVTGSGTALAPVTVCASPPIGTGMQTGTRQTVVSLPGATRVCFHTDGLTEARTGPDLFGTERLTQTVQALEPGSGASTLLDRVAEQTDARPDDMAACLLAVEGPDKPPRVLAEQIELGPEKTGERTERFLAACGIDAAQATELMSAVSAAAEQRGEVLLEVRLDGESPHISLRSDDVASLRAVQPARQAAVGAVQ